MAKKSIVARSNKRMKTVARYAAARALLKSKISDETLGDDERQAAETKFHQLPRNSSSVRVHRRCVQCGRPHAVYRRFGLCRICLRESLMLGLVPGGRKSSW